MAGPLVKVNTTVAGINLDVSRLLNLGRDVTMEFLVPDITQSDGLRPIKHLTKSFDRLGPNADTDGDSKKVYFRVADRFAELAEIFREPNLYVRVSGDTFKVQDVDKPEPNVAQVYTMTCVTRTLRTNFEVK